MAGAGPEGLAELGAERPLRRGKGVDRLSNWHGKFAYPQLPGASQKETKTSAAPGAGHVITTQQD